MTANLTDPVDVLARTIWGEARGEPPGGMEAVASVIINRVTHPRWWGHNVITVCFAREQFDCWDMNDPNRAKCLSVTTKDPVFVKALDISKRAISGLLEDTTKGADSYVDLRFAHPDWATPDRMTVKIGNQTFYRLEIHDLPNKHNNIV